MSNVELLPGRYPGVIESVDYDLRQVRISVPGMTTSAENWLLAEVEYPLGSRSSGQYPTEIEILPGDKVWLAFIGGDSRYPIVTGYRNPNAGNNLGWRRWHHANIELLADETLRIITTDGKHCVELNGDGIKVVTAGDLTADVAGNMSATVTGNASVDAENVILNGGGAGGLVCQSHLCAFTGSPHIQASATVKAGN